MRIFRRLSSRSLAVLLGGLTVFGVSTALALTALGSDGSTPPPAPLSQAIHDALSASPVDGVTARINFTDNLLGSSALGSLASAVGSPLLSGASGRLWLTNDGHLRLELQSDAGDAQIVSDGTILTVYDASSNTAYQLALPQDSSTPATSPAVPAVSEIATALAQLAGVADISGAVPDSVAGHPAYTVTVSSRCRGWNSKLTASDGGISPPTGAKIVPITLPAGSASTTGGTTPVTGLAAVAAALPFTLAAPDSLNGLARSDVRLTGTTTDPGALVTYGQGLGTVLVSEHAAPSGSAYDATSPLAMLPGVSINGSPGHELATTLGTIVEFTRGGVSYTVAGSVTQSDAELAARALAP